jgi:alkylation response protein AidB-like acyl-CoA dehydrogenase
LREYAVRKAKQTVPMQAVPYGRTPQIGKAHPALQEEVIYVEDAAQSLAALAESALRKHGRNIVEQQLQVSRIADIAIDLLALCTTIARTTRIIEQRGLPKAKNEVSMTYTFYSDARRRIRSNLKASTGRNNDDSLQHVADDVITSGGYKNDFIK